MRKLFSDRYVHYLDCGNVSQVHMYVKTYQIVYLKYVQFMHVSYNSKSGFLKTHTHTQNLRRVSGFVG